MKKITIIIVNYHSNKLIATQITKLNDISRKISKIIIVDNSSNFELLCPTNINLEVKKPGFNAGFGAAVNLAVNGSNLDLFLMLNPDVCISNETMGQLIRLVERDDVDWGTINCTVGKKKYANLNCLPGFFSMCDIITLGFAKKILLNLDMKEKLYVDGSLLFMRKELFELVGGFNDLFLYGEDTVIGYRLSRMEKPFTYFNKLDYTHFRSTSSGEKSSSFKYQRVFYAHLNFLKEHRGRIVEAWIFYMFLLLYNIFSLVIFVAAGMKERKTGALSRLIALWELRRFAFSKCTRIEGFHRHDK